MRRRAFTTTRAHAVHIERPFAAMQAWQARVGDTLALNRASQPPPKIDLTGKERKPDPWQPGWIVKKYFESRP